ncbi:hypothetical protein IF2G_07958 [Cordyceps javanica]|nr:hypothetical protein IF2G_07958 [Cordyceps javanica]
MPIKVAFFLSIHLTLAMMTLCTKTRLRCPSGCAGLGHRLKKNPAGNIPLCWSVRGTRPLVMARPLGRVSVGGNIRACFLLDWPWRPIEPGSRG